MKPDSIRYRYAALLIWATVAVVTNPVLHAIGHSFNDEHSHAEEDGASIHLISQDLCPYCDALAEYAVACQPEAKDGVLVPLWDIEPSIVLYANHRDFLSIRPRAPPVKV